MHHTISQSKTKKCFVIGKCQCSTRKSVLLKFYQGSVSLLNVNDVEVNIGPPSFFHPRIVQKVFHRVVIRILKIGQRSYSHKKVLMNDSIDVDFQNGYFRMKRREEGTTWETFTKVYKKGGDHLKSESLTATLDNKNTCIFLLAALNLNLFSSSCYTY